MELSLASLVEWFKEHPEILAWLGGSSVFIFCFSILGVSYLVSIIPEDYFLPSKRTPTLWKSKVPILRLVVLVIKNIIGILLIMGGIMMLVLPGQGLLTIVTGFLFLDYPGKFIIERRIVSYPAILAALNWIRKRNNKPSLKV